MYNYPNKKPQFSPWDHLNGPIIADVAWAEVARLPPYARHLHEPPTPTGNDVEAIFCPPGGPPSHSLSNYCPPCFPLVSILRPHSASVLAALHRFGGFYRVDVK